MPQSVLLSVVFFPPGGGESVRLTAGRFSSPEEVVSLSLKELRSLPSEMLKDGRVVIDWVVRPETASKTISDGVLIRRQDSLFDALSQEATRFFD
jgi:hypothetical protein